MRNIYKVTMVIIIAKDNFANKGRDVDKKAEKGDGGGEIVLILRLI